jgi:hypothetical protein
MSDQGREDLLQALSFETPTVDDFIHTLGFHGLNYLIRVMTDAIYPEELFGKADDVQPLWLRGNGGSELDPGVRWVMLLRLALTQVEP